MSIETSKQIKELVSEITEAIIMDRINSVDREEGAGDD